MTQNSSIAALDIFSELDDPRQQGKVKYPLNSCCALCVHLRSRYFLLNLWNLERQSATFLKSLLPFANGIPSHDTFGAVFSSIDRKRFGELFVKWVQALQAEIPGLVAIDGKTVRGSKNGSIPPVHIISAWASDQNLVMGQVKTDVKSNEIRAIPELLEMLGLKKALVSIDAMGCQKEIAERIISKKADYLLSVVSRIFRTFRSCQSVFVLAQAALARPLRAGRLRRSRGCKGRDKADTMAFSG